LNLQYIKKATLTIFYSCFLLLNQDAHAQQKAATIYSTEVSTENLFFKIFDFISLFWNYELFTSQNYPVTIGMLILGITLLILGYFASNFLSKKLVTKLLSRFNLNQGASAAIQALTFYALLVTFALAALKIINVPLTMFTVLGGAFAIGIGFGSQNLVNNFISGLILLAEQPIRVGDLIEVEGYTGIIKRIGARSTAVRTANNIDIIVPNSSFLEKNVINWTRSNTQMRLNVKVGVDYGSDLNLVSETLIKAANTHKKVLPSPKPFVLFTEFGDSALNFELLAWANIRNTSDRQAIESDLRFRINDLFIEKNISIPFPHQVMVSNKAIEVKILNE